MVRKVESDAIGISLGKPPLPQSCLAAQTSKEPIRILPLASDFSCCADASYQLCSVWGALRL